MQLAGKYATDYAPDVFPNQRLMHALAAQTQDPELKDAALTYQYPFRLSELQNSNYSQKVKESIIRATVGALG